LIYPLKDLNDSDTSCQLEQLVGQTRGSVAVKAVFCSGCAMEIVEPLLFEIIDLIGKIAAIHGL
jgi:hypothetical protein